MITQRLAWHARPMLETPFQGQGIIVLKIARTVDQYVRYVFGGFHEKFPRLWPCVEFGEISTLKLFPFSGS
jgi:hypothetical protein